MVYYVYILAAFVLGITANLLFEYLAKYTALSVYEVANDMVPIERELLEEIVEESESWASEPELTRDACYRRKRVRLNLDAIQVRLHRIVTNAARPKYWARTDLRMIRKNRLEHPPEVFEGIKQVLHLEWEVRRLALWLLFRIWLWNISGFQRREWGPMPDVQKFSIVRVLDAYERLKSATVELARSYGEAAIAEELAVRM